MAMNPESQPDDRTLVRDFLAARSEAAFLRLYDRHADRLYRFAARLSGGRGGAAADLAQETWLRALEALPGFGWNSALGTWLCGIALNCWRETRRGDQRARNFTVIAGTRPPHPPASADAVALERAIAALPDGYREVLLLHDLEGYTHEEIARHFGIAAGTSKSQLHHARRAVRATLGHESEAQA